MDCASIREDIEAYALGALDAVVARRVETHIADCTSCDNLARAYARAVDELALTVPIVKAPPRPRERVLGGVGAFRPTVTPATLVRTSRWWAAAAAVFLAVAIGAGVWAAILSDRVNQLEADNAALAELTQLDVQQRAALLRVQGELSVAKSQQRVLESMVADQAKMISIALDPDLIETALEGTALAPAAACRYVWSTKQTSGALTCQNLPAISFALTYQLWAVRSDVPVSMGIFSPRQDGSAHLLYKPSGEGPGGPITDIFVTLEVANQTRGQPSAEVVLGRAPSQQASR